MAHVELAQIPTVLIGAVRSVRLHQVSSGVTIARAVVEDHHVEEWALTANERFNVLSVLSQNRFKAGVLGVEVEHYGPSVFGRGGLASRIVWAAATGIALDCQIVERVRAAIA